MKRRLLTICLLSICIFSYGQKSSSDQAAKNVKEGKLLYKSEMASWYGSDLFQEKFPKKVDQVGGYISYSKNDISTCVFFSKGTNPHVICSLEFDQTYNTQTAKVDSIERELLSLEIDLIDLRNKSVQVIDSDTLFKKYSNTGLNVIPIIENAEKKVYVLTGPKNEGYVIFGNDYLLTFDIDNKLVSKKSLHKNIIPIKYSREEGVITMHSHLPETGDLITPTDICTLMLYEKAAKWKQHIVISTNTVSVWDCESNQLETMTKKDWDIKMAKETSKQ